METNKQTHQCEKALKIIIDDPCVEVTYSKGMEYQIKHNNKTWLIWALTDRYSELNEDGSSGDIFYETPERFYERGITKTLKVPANSAKEWRVNEINAMCILIEFGDSLNKIPHMFKRNPSEVLGQAMQFSAS